MVRALLVGCILSSGAFAAQIVEGHVVNAATGAAIPGVRVTIFPIPGVPSDGHSTSTDSQGRFRIEGVAEGAYSARYTAPGFRPIPNPGDRLPPFPITGGEPMRLEIKMQPMGKLSGRVLDAAGKPVPNAGIWLIGSDRWCKPPTCFPDHRQLKANDKGEYTITDLQPGPWLVSATAPPSWDPPESRDGERLGWAQTFYPGVTDPQLAEAVIVGIGSDQWNPDIKLAAAPQHRLRGRVLDSHDDPVSKASVSLAKGFGPSLTQVTKGDGAFEFPDVTDDEWRLSAVADRNGVKQRAVQSVEIKRRDVENIELRLADSFSIEGRIVIDGKEGAPAPQPPRVDLVLVSNASLLADEGVILVGSSSDEGDFTIRNVYPGTYKVQLLSESPVPYYLDSIRLGDRDAAGWASVVSGSLPLTLTYKYGGGTVRGTVEACASGHVLLIPQEPDIRRAGFLRVAACGKDGRFELPAVRPGEYYGFALAGPIRSGPMFWDDSLLKQGSKVTVRDNETTAADIPVISR